MTEQNEITWNMLPIEEILLIVFLVAFICQTNGIKNNEPFEDIEQEIG